MVMKAFKEGTDQWVRIEDEVTSFRGEKAVLTACTRARGDGRTGKVCVRFKDTGALSELYDTVFDLEVREVES